MSASSRDFFESHFALPEMKLLLAGCRKIAGTIDDGEWEERVSAPIDHSLFIELCRRNRVSLAINKSLVRPCKSRLPSVLVDEFAQDSKRIGLSQLRLSKSMIDVHRAFQGGKIRHLFLKGPVLNGLLYGEETLRFSGDLDVLIEPGNIGKADSILAELGYDTSVPRRALRMQSPLFQIRHKDVSFRKKGERHSIELHWKTDKVETMLNRGIFDWETQVAHVRLHNESFPMMEDYHNCLYLCLHGAKHNWMRIQWLLDIALLIQWRGIDRAALMELAGRYGLRNVVHEAFFLCGFLLKIGPGNAGFEADGKYAARAIRRFHLANLPDLPGTRRRLVYHRGLLYPCNGPRQKFWFKWIIGRALNRIRPGTNLESAH